MVAVSTQPARQNNARSSRRESKPRAIEPRTSRVPDAGWLMDDFGMVQRTVGNQALERRAKGTPDAGARLAPPAIALQGTMLQRTTDSTQDTNHDDVFFRDRGEGVESADSSSGALAPAQGDKALSHAPVAIVQRTPDTLLIQRELMSGQAWTTSTKLKGRKGKSGAFFAYIAARLNKYHNDIKDQDPATQINFLRTLSDQLSNFIRTRGNKSSRLTQVIDLRLEIGIEILAQQREERRQRMNAFVLDSEDEKSTESNSTQTSTSSTSEVKSPPLLEPIEDKPKSGFQGWGKREKKEEPEQPKPSGFQGWGKREKKEEPEQPKPSGFQGWGKRKERTEEKGKEKDDDLQEEVKKGSSGSTYGDIPGESLGSGDFDDESITYEKPEAVGGQLNKLDEVHYNFGVGKDESGDFKKGEGTFEGYFKKDVDKDESKDLHRGDLTSIGRDDPQFGKRNIAMQRIDKLLGGDVITPTFIAKHKGKMGIVMKKIEGVTGKDTTKEQMQNPVVRQGLSKLWLLDIICGQVDRHPGNYMIEIVEGKIVSVKGIDNDLAFGSNLTYDRLEKTKGGGPFTPFAGKRLSDLNEIDRTFAERIVQLANQPELVRTALNGLLSDPAAIDGVIERLTSLAKFLKPMLDDNDGRLVTEWK